MPIYRFDQFELRPDEGRLLFDDKHAIEATDALWLTLLITLVKNPLKPVSRAYLYELLWPHEVSKDERLDSRLQVQVWTLRQQLSQFDRATKFVLPTRGGYKFARPVEVFPTAAEAQGNIAVPPYRLASWLELVYRKAAKDWQTMHEQTWIETYGRDLRYIRAALEWAFSRDGNAQTGLDLLSRTAHLWYFYGSLDELDSWITKASEHLGAATPRIVGTLALHQCYRADGSTAVALARQAIDAFAEAGDQDGLIFANVAAAHAAYLRGRLDEAETHLQDARAILRPASSLRARERYLQVSVLVDLARRDFLTARESCQDLAQIADRLGSWRSRLIAGHEISEAYFACGEVTEAIDNSRELLESCSQEQLLSREAVHINGCLGGYLLVDGKTAEGRRRAKESLKASRDIGYRPAYKWGIERLALAAAQSGRLSQAALLMGYADACCETERREATMQIIHDRLRSLLLNEIAERKLDELARKGRTLSEAQALKLALNWRAAKSK